MDVPIYFAHCLTVPFLYSFANFSCLLSFFFFLGLHLQHMEVPRLGDKLELQLPAYTTATVTPDPSHVCDLYHSSRQCGILNSRDRTHNLMVPSQICFCCTTMGTPVSYHFWFAIIIHLMPLLKHTGTICTFSPHLKTFAFADKINADYLIIFEVSGYLLNFQNSTIFQFTLAAKHLRNWVWSGSAINCSQRAQKFPFEKMAKTTVATAWICEKKSVSLNVFTTFQKLVIMWGDGCVN